MFDMEVLWIFLPGYLKRPNGLKSSDQMLQMIDSQPLHNCHISKLSIFIDSPSNKRPKKKQIIHNYRLLENNFLSPQL